MEPGDRVGLIGRNGIGKTTLLKLVAGTEEPDEGSVVFNNDARFEYLHQLPVFDSNEIIIDAVMKAKPKVYNSLEEHTRLCALLEQEFDDTLSEKVQDLNREIEDAGGWALEREAEKILHKLGITDINQSVGSLSGGLKKRVALSKALLSAPDLLILDEPTNHLDVDSVQWLQDRLQAAGTSLLIVTHDRYFLDAVSTRIIELDQNKLYSFPGNYQTYLERKELLVEAQNSEANRARVKLRTELAWLQRGARARRTKQRSRIDWISELSKQTTGVEEKKIKIELGSSFMGSRIIDAHNISKTIGGKLLFDDYTYLSRPGDRIGIIGPNGSGKSSMLNVLSGKLKTDTGAVKFGPTSKIGYFRQDNDELNPNLSVIGSLKEIAEYIDTGIGRDRYLTTKDLLNKFLFPSRQHSSLVGTLSGGEKRRLMLLRVLMANPNVLLLDEPTNDLDIQTLNSLESYLDDFYGVLIVVSHDRAFLDRCVGIVIAFDGKGNVK
jgi:ATP-binding cassette subfamily F protein uup